MSDRIVVFESAHRTRYRNGDRDTASRTAHTAQSVEYRRSLREAEFGSEEIAELFSALRAGRSLRQAAAVVGQSPQGVYGRARWDYAFEQQLERVLAKTCPAGDWCGSSGGVKHGGHCRTCRDAHHPPRMRTGRRRR